MTWGRIADLAFRVASAVALFLVLRAVTGEASKALWAVFN